MNDPTDKPNRSHEPPDSRRSGERVEPINRGKLERAFSLFVEATPLGKADATETAKRAAAAWAESLLDGYLVEPEDLLSQTYPLSTPVDASEMIMVKDIAFHGLCPHHLLPFRGSAHVAYEPLGQLASLSSLAKLVHCFAHRLEIQEIITRQIGETLMHRLPAAGVAVALATDQACMTMRGVKQTGATTVTQYFGGTFRQNAARRGEFLASVG